MYLCICRYLSVLLYFFVTKLFAGNKRFLIPDNLFQSCPVIWKFCTVHDWTTEMDVTDGTLPDLVPWRFGCDFKYSTILFYWLVGILRSLYDNALRWIPRNITDDKSTLVHVTCCLTAPSHYLSQCWPRSMSPYGVIRPQWGKMRFAGIYSIAKAPQVLWTWFYTTTISQNYSALSDKNSRGLQILISTQDKHIIMVPSKLRNTFVNRALLCLL